MKRDNELIRTLMLDLEQADRAIAGDRHNVPGYSSQQVAYHLALILKEGYAEGPAPRYSNTATSSTLCSMAGVNDPPNPSALQVVDHMCE